MGFETNKLSYGGSMMLFLNGVNVAFSTTAKLDVKLSTREISSKDSGNWKDKAAGKLEWSASSDALYCEPLVSGANNTTFDDLFTSMTNRTAVTFKFAATTGTGPSNDWTADNTKKYYDGSAFITGLSVNAPDGESTTYSITLEGTGVLAIH